VHTDLSEIEGVVDLAVVAVPASTVGSVVAQCGAKGVRGLIVISAGFGESGDEPSRQSGLAAQRSLVGQARAFGMRVVGPNCLGVINTDEAVSLNASLAPLAPPTGRAGFFCQSGALGVAILGEAARRGIGVSTFVSAGNRADVSGNDMLQYWESDPATDIALLYLESFGNPRKFARIARRFARRKPIVAVKSGRGTVVAGLQYTSAQVPDEAVEALFEASGVIRTETLTQLFDVASLLGTQPLPRGDRIAVVGHSTALAVLVADGLSTAGLPLALIIDVGVDASPESFGRQVRAALDSEDVDAVISVFVPPMRRGEEFAVAAQLRDAVVGRDKPLLSVFMGFDGIPAELSVAGTLAPSYGSIPSYPSPERAVGALRHVVRFANWRRREAGSVPQIAGIDTAAAKEFLLQVLRADPTGRELGEQEAQRLLAWYGINVLASTLVTDEHAAVEAAESLGWPVALKLAGAVRLYLHDGRELAEAWRSLGLRASDPAVVQVMAPRGVDTVLTMHDDRSFGSLVSFGVGGLATDLLEDRAYAVVPLTSLDAAELISAPKAFPLLTGYGGADESDLESLVELALRLSALADDLPEVVHCRLDPVVASPSGAHVLSATVRVAPPLGRDRVRARRLGH